MKNNLKVAIFLSGAGSNARNLLRYFSNNNSSNSINLLLTNKKKSGAEAIAQDFKIPFVLFNRRQFYEEESIIKCLIQSEIDLIILAGFLWIIPENLIKAFPNRIINIHPALLPNYGGKGMYGIRVHEAVHQNKEKETGITIHLVNEEYDKGKVLFQKSVAIDASDNPSEIAKKVQNLEYENFPQIIERYIQELD